MKRLVLIEFNTETKGIVLLNPEQIVYIGAQWYKGQEGVEGTRVYLSNGEVWEVPGECHEIAANIEALVEDEELQ